MPPKNAKTQGTLSSFFGGGGGGRTKSNESAGAKSSSKEVPPQEAKQLTEKITIKGYKGSSATPSPSKAPPVRGRASPSSQDMAGSSKKASTSASASESKYFANGKSGSKSEPMQIDDDDDEEELPPVKTRGRPSAAGKKRKAEEDEDYDDAPKASKSGRSSSSAAKKTPTKTRKVVDDDDDEDEEEVKPKAKASAQKSSASKSSPKGSSSSRAIDLDNDDDGDEKPKKASRPADKKSSAKSPEQEEYDAAVKAARDRRAAGPATPGSKEIPEGKPNCLAGLTFVFTGQLESLTREDASDMVKRYGAKVTGGPSSKTSYVVLGEGAGPAKVKSIKQNGIKTLTEDGLLDLIRSRGEGEPDEAALKKIKAEEDKIKKAAKQLGVAGGGTSVGHKGTATHGKDLDQHTLWTTKYAPQQIKDLVGNNAAVEKLGSWLAAWPSNYKTNFKKPGPHGHGIKRAMMLSGPPGIGKTTAAHLCSRLQGFNPIELNASDTRSKKLIEDSLKNLVNNKSLDGWYGGGDTGSSSMSAGGITIGDRSVLILDEVDGMSGGDRGGVGAINQLIKKTKIPIILIANDRKSPKMRPFDATTADNKFQKPKADSVRSRLQTIAYREGLKVDKTAMDQLIAGAGADMRLVINMLSTWKLSQKAMSFDEGKQLGAANAKPGMHTPFSLYSELSSHGLWTAASRKTLNEKADLYFQDHSFIPLFVQENYLRQQPQRAANERDERLKELKSLQLMTEASSSISDGDVVDGMIHGPQQHWGLMPLHAIASTIKPMSLVYGMTGGSGTGGGYGGQGFGPTFPSWLGQNSKLQRLSRAVVELQTKMRLAASGSRWEVREQYAPFMFTGLVSPLIKEANNGIDDVISLMDAYYLGLEDRDTILELGIGANDGEALLKKIPTAVKTAFTRSYNTSSHPVAFQRADPGSVKAKAKQLTGDAAPDVEEAVVEDEIFDESADEMAGDSDDDFAKDKMIKEKKQKAAKGAAKSTAKGKGKGK